ncbi:MAG: alcohol dehydrogenase catalytic domain-containing protein [Anaerolineae bacterium]|nr:alcohol dehydrogenase catalytic domain-containing protein [Anaerolineae bacterium]
MRALRYDDTLHLTNTEPEPTPGADEALIRLRRAGICHTDLELTRGYMGFRGVLGHEFVGELVHDVGAWQAGQRVVGEINIGCGNCDLCREGIPTQCRNRSTLGLANYPGVFSDYFRLPIRNLHAVPDTVPDEVAVFTEPLAAALQAIQLTPIHPTDRVVLIGAGKLGLPIAQLLQRIGCDLTVVARQPRPVALLEQWGIPYVQPDANGQIPIERQSAHVVVDCTGSAEGFAAALDLVRPRGIISLKSTYVGLPQANLTRIVVDEITVIGTRCGPFPAALRLMESNQVDVRSMIERCYSLDESLAAFEHAAQRGVLKVLLAL